MKIMHFKRTQTRKLEIIDTEWLRKVIKSIAPVRDLMINLTEGLKRKLN